MRLFTCLILAFGLAGCVDLANPVFNQNVNVIVVDGTITNLAESQIVSLGRSLPDPISGRFGTLPITKATVDVVMDGTQAVRLHETLDGRYQLPTDFRAQPGHTYQLTFTLTDGTRYASTPELMPDPVPIGRVHHRFNPVSLPESRSDGQRSYVRAAHDILVDWQDPAHARNFYRWDWVLWEKQDWCRSCRLGYYLPWNIKDQSILFEDCYRPFEYVANGGSSIGDFVNDYPCRTRCWEILYSYELNLFNDALSNGGMNLNRRVAQIPYYQDNGALVEIRQSSLTQQAHQYFNRFQAQTQNTGGLADTPPTVLVGNVRNTANAQEAVVGYFSAASVTSSLYWLDREDATGTPPGLFYALSGLKPSPEDYLVDPNTGKGKPIFGFTGKNGVRPPTAVCESTDGRTPFKPKGWRD